MSYKSDATVRELVTWRPATGGAVQKRTGSMDEVLPVMLCKGYLPKVTVLCPSQELQLLKRTGDGEVVPQLTLCSMPVPPLL